MVVAPEDQNIALARENHRERQKEPEKRKRGRPSRSSASTVEEEEVQVDSGGQSQEESDANANDPDFTTRAKRTRNCGDGDEGDDDPVWAKVPRNLVERLTPLAEKMNWSIRDQLMAGMAVYEILGIDSTEMDNSLASTWRKRRQHAAEVASDTLEEAVKDILEAKAKVFVHFDEVEVVQDMQGKKEKKTRLVILVSSPAMAKSEQLLCALPMDERTGAAIADTIYMILEEHGLQNSIMGIVADTTAANYGRYSGAVTILQVQLHLQLHMHQYLHIPLH